MRQSVRRYVERLNTRRFTNNVQRVLYTLLNKGGEWVDTGTFRVNSADSRLRDLRKNEYGRFNVVCRRQEDTTQYRIVVRDLTVAQLREVFPD